MQNYNTLYLYFSANILSKTQNLNIQDPEMTSDVRNADNFNYMKRVYNLCIIINRPMNFKAIFSRAQSLGQGKYNKWLYDLIGLLKAMN